MNKIVHELRAIIGTFLKDAARLCGPGIFKRNYGIIKFFPFNFFTIAYAEEMKEL